MKKIFYLLFLLFITTAVSAQYFPGRHYKSYLGKRVKVVSKSDRCYDVYKKPNILGSRYAQKDGYTPMQALADKVFMVIGFEKGKYGEFFFVLVNAETGKLYYRYHDDYEGFFELQPVEDFDFGDEVCSEIISSIDKFDGQILKRMSTNYRVYFSRNGDDIFVILHSTSKSLSVMKTGATILLADGNKIKNTECEIEVKATETGYDYTTIFKLTAEDLEKLKRSYITDYRLYIYDTSVYSGKICQKLLECIVND